MQRITDKLHLHRHKTAQQQAAPVKPTSVPLNAQGQPIPVSTLESSFASTTLGTTQLQQQQGWTAQQGFNGQQQGWSNIDLNAQNLQQGATLQKQQVWTGQQVLQQELHQTTLHTTTRAPIVETHVRAPIIEQTTRINKVVEIQPIIHREIDAPQVRIIEQHSYESAPMSGPALVTRAAIVEETIRPTLVEEIQPILHREVPAPYLERVEQHITENVVAPTTTTKQVMSESRTLGVQEATQRGFISAPVVQPVQAPILHSHVAAPLLESHTRGTIVQQTVRPEKITEVQPIIHREIDAPQVRVIEQHSFEKVRSTGPSLINLQPIVQERVQPKIVEEIHPILHREVPAPYIERVEQHTQEHVVAPTTSTKQVFSEHKVTAGVPLVPQQRAVEAPILRSTTALPTTQQVNRPTIIQQTSRPEKITEVQPVIHREIDAPEVHVIEQHSYEKQRSMGPSLITKAAIIEETIIPKIIEEIQPVIHREVPQTVIEHQEQHTTERVAQPTVTTKSVMQDRTTKTLPSVARAVAAPLSAPVLHSTTAATQVQSHTRPTLVEQTVRPEKITEVQPIVHRQIDATQVHVIEQHTYEKVPSAGPGLITKQAIVEETLHPTIIEEIQPVLHREVPAPFVERVEQHLSEHVTQPTVSTKEVVMDRTAHWAPAGGPVLPATTTTSTTTTTTTLNTAVVAPPPLPVKSKHAHKRI